MKLKLIILAFAAVCAFGLFNLAFSQSGPSKEITLIYTGDTHAMLYPCNCPVQPDGGISRRATLIKQLRKSHPNSLVLDSGSFFAGGLLDEYSQNTELDKKRNLVNLKALQLMNYDALNIAEDEFNFGKEFLREQIEKTGLKFVSTNIKIEKSIPYIIKDVAGIKIGIIGLGPLYVRQKAERIDVLDPNSAAASAVSDLKKQGVNLIIALSHLGESQNINLVNSVAGIDILIGNSNNREEPSGKAGNTFILRPAWQGRKIGKFTFSLKDNKITGQKHEDLRLSDKITDDPDVSAIRPVCFSDNNCRKEGSSGICQQPGELKSNCSYTAPKKVNLTVILSKACSTCNTARVEGILKNDFPGLTVNYLYYPDKKAQDIVKRLGIDSLPVYLLGKEAESEKSFQNIKQSFDFKAGYYMLKPEVSGLAYFFKREKIKNKFDVFLSLFGKDTGEVLKSIKGLNPDIHLLVVENNNGLEAAGGVAETEESLRSVCVQKYYPEHFWSYISCRAKNPFSSWWQDCLGKYDANQITACAKGADGLGLLRQNIRLNKELKIMFGPTYLKDNQEVFSSTGVPSTDELKKVLKK